MSLTRILEIMVGGLLASNFADARQLESRSPKPADFRCQCHQDIALADPKCFTRLRPVAWRRGHDACALGAADPKTLVRGSAETAALSFPVELSQQGHRPPRTPRHRQIWRTGLGLRSQT